MRFCFLLVFCVPLLSKAQTNIFPASGNVGIGTINPRGALDVEGNGDIHLANLPNMGTSQSLFLPDGRDIFYLQGEGKIILEALHYKY